MSEESQSILYIGYAVLFFLGFMLLLGFFLPGLTSIESNIEATHTQDYRKAIILENMLSLDADTQELYGYDYTHRRAVIPVEYFSNKNPGPGGIGFNVTGSQVEHCYIPRVEGLDGTHFAFRIKPLVDESKRPGGQEIGQMHQDYKSIKFIEGEGKSPCTDITSEISRISVVSTAMLVREDKNNTMLPVRLYVYDRASYVNVPDIQAP